MSSDLYTLLSLAMRYWFALLAAVIVWRAWRITLRDSRRARLLRAWAPNTGAIGELIVTGKGSHGFRKGMRIPVPKEGLMGASRRCDVRLKHPDVRRYHVHIELRENGLLMETIGRSEVSINDRTGAKLLIRNRDKFSIGALTLQFILYEQSGPAAADEDELFSPVSYSGKTPRSKPRKRKDVQKLFDIPQVTGTKKSKNTTLSEEEYWWPNKKR